MLSSAMLRKSLSVSFAISSFATRSTGPGPNSRARALGNPSNAHRHDHRKVVHPGGGLPGTDRGGIELTADAENDFLLFDRVQHLEQVVRIEPDGQILTGV